MHTELRQVVTLDNATRRNSRQEERLANIFRYGIGGLLSHSYPARGLTPLQCMRYITNLRQADHPSSR